MLVEVILSLMPWDQSALEILHQLPQKHILPISPSVKQEKTDKGEQKPTKVNKALVRKYGDGYLPKRPVPCSSGQPIQLDINTE